MIRTTAFKLAFTWEDEVDVTIRKEDGRIKEFGVNYRAKIGDKWHNVIRYDTAHGMIHVHKFWASPKIIPLRARTAAGMKTAVIEAVKDIKSNWKTYRNCLVERVKRNGKQKTG